MSAEMYRVRSRSRRMQRKAPGWRTVYEGSDVAAAVAALYQEQERYERSAHGGEFRLDTHFSGEGWQEGPLGTALGRG